MDAFLYFYPENFHNETPPPQLLIQGLKFAMDAGYRVTLCCPLALYDKVEQQLSDHPLDFYESQLSHPQIIELHQKYFNLIKSKKIVSNYPPVEFHCICRWLLMMKWMLDTDKEYAFSFDWDTILFAISRHAINREINALQATKKPFLLTHKVTFQEFSPIFLVCPHAVVIHSYYLMKYCEYIFKYLDECDQRQLLITNFSDCVIWSSIIALAAANGHWHCWAEVGLRNNIVLEHNFRSDDLYETEVFLKRKDYLLEQKNINWQHDKHPYLYAKHFKISDSGVLYTRVLKSHASVPYIEEDLHSGWMHFSGTEGKYVFFKHFLPSFWRGPQKSVQGE